MGYSNKLSVNLYYTCEKHFCIVPERLQKLYTGYNSLYLLKYVRYVMLKQVKCNKTVYFSIKNTCINFIFVL